MSPAQLCVWHPAVNTHPTMVLRRSNLKLLFGQEKRQLCTRHGLHKGCEQQPGRGQSVPDVVFHVENTLPKGGSEEHTRRGCAVGA